MKQEANKKSKKWLWLIIAIVAVLAVVGVVLGIVLSGGNTADPDETVDNAPKGGRADLYWNIDREQYGDPTTGMSSREPGADGKYRVTFAHEGEQVEYVVADKRLVNYIDTVDAMGLVFDDNDTVIEVVDVNTIAKEVAKSFYVVKVEGNVITLNGSASLDGMVKQITCEELTKIYNFAGERETKGEIIQPEDIQPLDTVLVYGNDMDQVTHIGVMFSPVASAIYWRVQQFYNYAADVRSTTRVPDEDGIYTVEMFCNGELLPLKFKVKEAVDAVDKVTSDICHFGLIFDEDGYVIATQASQLGIRGRIACSQYDVTEVDGATFTATRVVGGGNDVGNTYTGTLPEGVPVYDASAYYLQECRGKDVGAVQIGDRITVWEDTLGNIVEIYIYNRIVDGPVYFRTDAIVNRQPDENGWYNLEIFDGESIKMYRTKSEPLCRFLEQNKFFGLEVKGTEILDGFGYTRVVGHGYVDYARYNYSVSSVAGSIIALTSPDAKTMVSKVVSPNCKIYNMSGIHQEIGAETTIQTGDRGWFISDASGQLVWAFISERKVDAGVYYNLNRRYDGTNKCTARTPDENGYYVFEMAHEGKQVTIKTRSKAVASKIDEISNCIVGLNPDSKGIVTDAYRGTAATGGQTQAGGEWTFECYTEDGQIQLAKPSAPETKFYVMPADDMKTYNVASVGFKKFRGEADTLEVGDRVLVLTDANNKAVISYIIGQTFDDVTRMCEHCNKKVTFKPWLGTNFSLLEEASGHYYIPANGSGCSTSILGDVPKEEGDEIIIDLNGKTMEFAEGQRNFIIYNKVKLSIIDSVGGGKMINPFFNVGGFGGKMDIYGGTFELPAEHQVITAGGVINISGSFGTTVNFYGGKFVSKDPKIEAIAIKNSTVNIHSGFTVDGGVRVSSGAEVNMSGTVKISKLQIDKGILLDFTKLGSKSKIGIVARGVFTTEMSSSKLSAVKKLLSCPVKGGSIVVEGKQLACYGTEPDYTQVYEQSLKMDFSDTENLPTTCPFCDRAATWEPLPEPDLESQWGNNVVLGGGKHYYLDTNRSIGGVYMLDGGDVCLHLNGKTITSTGREIFTIFGGKTLAVMGKGTMKGSGNSEGGYIASVISNNGTLNLCGGTYVATSKGDMPIIANRGDAGNEINVYDGTIKTEGVAIKARMRNVSIYGGTVNGSVSTENLKNSQTGEFIGANVILAGGTVDAVKVVEHGTLEISGKPVVKKLTIAEGILAEVGTLKSGAKIAVDATGIFTTDFASKSAAQKALKYFTVAKEGASLKVKGKALFCEPAPFDFKAIIKQANAMKFPTDSTVYAADCPYCEESVLWTPLSTVVDYYSETNQRYEQFLYSTRHYYADKNLTLTHGSLQTVTADAPCVHLNGKTITAIGSRVFTSQMNIMGNGTAMVANKKGVEAPATVVAPNTGIVNIFGGTYTTAKDVALTGTSGIFVFHGGTSKTGAVNFYAGEIKGVNNDAVKVYNSGTFNMYGGKISGQPLNEYYFGNGEAAYVNIYGGEVEKIDVNEGYLDVQGGTVGRINITQRADGLKISGAPKITELKMLGEAKAEIGKLTKGASIGVNALGVFTTNFADAAAATAAKKYFSAVQAEAKIVVEGKALSSVGGKAPSAEDEDPNAPKPAEIVKAANKMSFEGTGIQTATCPKCNKLVTWRPLSAVVDYYSETNQRYEQFLYDTNHYYADKDLTLTHGSLQTVTAGAPCVHLNGKTITAIGNRVFTSAVNIMGNGTAMVANKKGVDAPAMVVAPNGCVVNIYGGTYTTAKDVTLTGTSGIFVFNGGTSKTGTVNFYGGEIKGVNNDAVKVYSNGTFNMYGGKISGQPLNEYYFGNGEPIYVNIYGGEVEKIDVNEGSLNVQGGTVGRINITQRTDELKISGAPKITELKMLGEVRAEIGKLTKGASIGVNALGVFTTDFADAAAATAAKKYFSAVQAEASIVVDGNALACIGGTAPEPDIEPEPEIDVDATIKQAAEIIAEANAMRFGTTATEAKCPVCNETVIWQPITEAAAVYNGTLANAGHYFLANDISESTNHTLYFNNYSGQKAYCLHLNGKTVENTVDGRAAISVWTNQNTLNIMGTGTVKNVAGLWGALDVKSGATVNVYGGEYKCTSSDRDIAINVGGANTVVNIYDAKILESVNGYAPSGKLYVASGKANVFGGTYPYAYVASADSILNVYAGTINKLVTSTDFARITVSGKPVITEMDLTATTDKVTVGTLTTGAAIGVKANEGAFTKDFENAAAATAAKAFFTGISGEVKVEGKALAFTPDTTPGGGTEPPTPGTEPDPSAPTAAEIIAAANAMSFGETATEAKCPACNKVVTWLPITETAAVHNGTMANAGHYFLANDISNDTDHTLNFNNYSGQKAYCLHLNGKTVENTNAGKSAISVWTNQNTLNIMGNGTVKNTAGLWGALEVRNGATVNVYGGEYKCTSNDRDTAIGVGNANTVLNIYDAKILESVNGSASSGKLYIAGGKVNVYGGTYPYAHVAGELNVSGGTINKLVASATASQISVSGDPVITEMDLTAATIKLTVGELTTGASIKVKANEGVFTADFASTDAATAAKAFFTGISGDVKVEGKALAFTPNTTPTPTPDPDPEPEPEPDPSAPTAAEIIAAANAMSFGETATEAKCPACNKVVTWQPITEAASVHNGTMANAGHYFLANDISNAADHTLNFNNYSGQKAYCLHLNGKTVENTNAGKSAIEVWTNQQTLNIMGNGTVTNVAGLWGALDVKNGATVNVYGGEYKCTSSDRDAAINVANDGTVLNIYDATVLESVNGSASSGKLYIGGGKVNVYGGTYPYAHVAGELNVSGGTINKLVASATASQISVSGDPVITEMDLTAATIKLTVGELTTGASIKVKANEGVFTADFASADAATAAKAFFTGISGDVKVEGKALAFTPNTTPTPTPDPDPDPTPDPDPEPEPEPEPGEELTPAQIVAAAKAMTFPTDKSNMTATCPKCNKTVTWIALSDTADDATHSINGHYYLAEDLVDARTAETLVISANEKLCLHLNGHSISAATSGSWCAAVRGKTELNIFDNGNGSVNGNASAAVWANCPTNIYGGTYTASNTGAVFEIRNATGEAINFYDGKITSGDVRLNGANAAFKMYGGEYTGTGKIKGNNTFTGMVAGIYENAKISATGGITTYYVNVEVTGGEVSKIVGSVSAQSIKISGNPVITELDVTVSGTPLVEVGTLTGGSIGVKANGVFTTDFADEDAAKAAKNYFSAVDTTKGITVDGKALTCIDASEIPPEIETPEQVIAAANAMTFPTDGTSITAICPACGKNATWTALTETNTHTVTLTSGHYYLAEDITFNTVPSKEGFGYYISSADTEVCLHMNGKTVTADETYKCYTPVRVSAGSLNVMGGGLLTNNATNWAALDVAGNANVYGVNAYNNSGNRYAVAVKGGTTNLYGMTIEKGWIRVTGGVANVESGNYEGIKADNANATVNVKDGTLTNVNAVAGTLDVTGGTITKLTVSETATLVKLSGAPVITTLDMTAAGTVKLTVGELTEGAAIGVKANDGVFTETFADADAANAAKEFFTATEDGKAVTVKEDALAIVDASEVYVDPKAAIIAEGKAIASTAKAMTFQEGSIPTTCPKCGDVTWTALTQQMIDETTTHYFKGHYYLPDNIETDYAGLIINANGALCLHLNGKTITSTATTGFSSVIRGNTSLNIYDNGNGGINGGTNLAAIWPGCPDTNIYGGTYSSTESNSVVFDIRTGNVMNVFAGTVTSNGARVQSGAELNLYGGTFGGSKIWCHTSTARATVGIYGDAKVTATNGVSMYYMDLTVGGGELNKIGNYTGTEQSITICGEAVIKDLSGLTNNGVKATIGKLADGASIGLGTYTGVVTTAFENKAAAEAAMPYFVVAPGMEMTVTEAFELSYGVRTTPYTAAEIVTLSAQQKFEGTDPVEAYCYACNENVTWQPLTEAATVYNGVMANGGHYFVANDITASGHAINFNNYNAAKNYCLHLNGKTVSSEGAANSAILVWREGSDLNIMGDGTVMNVAGLWGALDIRACNVNVYGGEYKCTSNDRDIAINVNGASANVNIYDAKVLESVEGTPASGKLYVASGKANVYGGTYPYAHVAGELNVSGGTINKLVASGSPVISVSGDPVITEMDLTATTAKVTVGTLTTGASIGVKAEGVFTNDITDVNAAKAFFSAVASGKTIEVVEQTLSCVDAA